MGTDKGVNRCGYILKLGRLRVIGILIMFMAISTSLFIQKKFLALTCFHSFSM